MTADHAPVARIGQATALLATATFTGQFVSPLIFGPLEAATSASTTFLVSAAITGVTARSPCSFTT